jgi:hypothetical protein
MTHGWKPKGGFLQYRLEGYDEAFLLCLLVLGFPACPLSESRGTTASDGPGLQTVKVDGTGRRFFDYLARGVPHWPDDGTLAPWARRRVRHSRTRVSSYRAGKD